MPDAVSAHHRTSTAAAEYFLTGPIPRDSFLRSIHVLARVSNSAYFHLGHCLIGTQDANAAAYAAGRRLIQRSNTHAGGQPDILLGAITNAPLSWVLPVNQVIQSYPTYVLTRAIYATLGQTLTLLVTLDMLTLDEMTRLYGPARPVSIVAAPARAAPAPAPVSPWQPG